MLFLWKLIRKANEREKKDIKHVCGRLLISDVGKSTAFILHAGVNSF